MKTSEDRVTNFFLILYGVAETFIYNVVFITLMIIGYFLSNKLGYDHKGFLLFFLCFLSVQSIGKSLYLFGLLFYSKSLNQFPLKELGIFISNCIITILTIFFTFYVFDLSLSDKNTFGTFSTLCLFIMIDFMLTPYSYNIFRNYNFINQPDPMIENPIVVDKKKKGIFNFIFSFSSLTLGMIVVEYLSNQI
ncbi:hypothetical protein [Acinetobacter nosocomialis]|uniref:hypothetical protein n=1 Tax=Acinetobacter nosocomialis TaxID=106654 RepID=UPI0029D5F219|nr:hypothetical protein [Acinetobacter nosocomialis]MDX7882116.1 hypothetical protein [Acinetobacter nosocomialis]